MTQMLCSRMYPLSCANTYHDVWDFKVHERVRNKKIWKSQEQNMISLCNKKIIKFCLRWYTLKIYRFAAGEPAGWTFNGKSL